jgi:hypothetical protein
VVELSEELRFALESRDALRVRGEALAGSTLIATSRWSLVSCAREDLAHPAFAELGGDLVGAESLARLYAHRRRDSRNKAPILRDSRPPGAGAGSKWSRARQRWQPRERWRRYSGRFNFRSSAL